MDRQLWESDAEHCVSSWECTVCSESKSARTTKIGRIIEGTGEDDVNQSCSLILRGKKARVRPERGRLLKMGEEVWDQSAQGPPRGNDEILSLTSTADGHQGPASLRCLLFCCSTFHLSPPFPVLPALLPPQAGAVIGRPAMLSIVPRVSVRLICFIRNLYILKQHRDDI